MLGLRSNRSVLLALAASSTIGTTAYGTDCTTVHALQSFAETGTELDGATCSRFQGEAKKTGAYCFWPFPFRSQVANDWAASLWDQVTNCHTGTRAGSDARVNHPDSYDLLRFDTNAGTFHVSVKDKGGQDRTLVFFRYEHVDG